MKITLDIPEETFKTRYNSPEEFARALRLAAALYWYQRMKISQGRAAQIAGLNRKDFLEALAQEKVDIFVVDFDDLKQELERG